MRKSFKKIFCGALSLVLAGNIASFYALAYNVGDVVGEILSTDIVTYIEGVRVPSYNINGRTAIVTQHLNKLGGSLNFGVSFDEEKRALTITNKDIYGSTDSLVFSDTSSGKPIGTPIGNVYYTDITTNFEGTPIENFNIGGLTCVYADDLAKLCGTYLWDEEARTVKVYRSGTYIPYVTKKDAGRTLGAKESVITKNETFDRWADASRSHLTENADGTFSTIEIDEHINIETYDRQFNHISSFAIAKELPIFGALHFGKDYNYIAFGQENLLDDNSREVIKIVIYDKNFVKISEVSINNCKTAIPFDASGGQMYEDDRYLVLHTSRSQYLDENGLRPQTQLTVIVDKATWKPCNMLGKFQYNHTSHALREFVKIDDGRLITANYSDAAPIRGAFLQELSFDGKVVKTQGIFNVGGDLAANCTGAMIGGLEVSNHGYLVPISTIDHSLPTGYSSIDISGIERENRDIYLLWADKNTWELRHTCLARYTGVALTGSVPYIVKLADDNFMVMWQRFSDYDENSTAMCYAFVNSSGEIIGDTYEVNAVLSESCQPILSGDKVVWYVNTDDGRVFYNISANPPVISKDEQEPLKDKAETENPKIELENTKEEQKPREEKDKITEVDGI